MADISKSVELILRPNDQGLVQKLREVSEEFDVLGDGTSKFTGFANDLAGGVTDVNEKLQKTDEAAGLAESAFVRLGQAVLAFISFQTAQEFVNINIAMDKVKFTLTEVAGGATGANREFEFLKNTSYTLGVSIDALARPYAKLLEATKGTNLEGEVTRNLFLGISEAGAKLGLSSIEVERALKAVEQIASKGKVSLEEVRGQLGDAIPGAVNIFAQAAGLTTEQFFKVVEAGELSSDVLIRVSEILRERYGVAEGEKVDTLASAFGRLKTSVQLFATALGEAGANSAIKIVLDTISEGLRQSSEGFELWAAAAKDAKERYATEGWSGVFGAIETYISRVGEANRAQLFGREELDRFVEARLRLNDIEGAGSQAASALKTLGIPAENLRTAEVEKLAFALFQIAEGPSSGGQTYFITRLLEQLNRVPNDNVNLDSFREAVQRAFDAGNLNQAGFDAAINAIDTKANGLWATMLTGKAALDNVKVSSETLVGALNELATSSTVTGSQFLTGLLSALNKADDSADTLNRFKQAATEAFNRQILSPEEYVAAIGAIDTKLNGLWDTMLTGKDVAAILEGQLKSANDALKTLGVDPKVFKFEDIATEAGKLVKALEDLANSPVLTGSGFLTGLLSGLDKLKDNTQLQSFIDAARTAFERGKLTTEEYVAAIQAIQTKADGTWDSMYRGKEALDAVGKASKDAAAEQAKQATELQRQKEKADELAVKLEQIASNERIKLIESTVRLNIAEVEANSRIAVQILDNLAKMYTADIGLIGELTGQITNGYSTADQFRIKLVEEANQRINELHQSQMRLVEAQVEYIRARTAVLNSGSPILTVNAEGLEPHLEGMMWEIFRQIQIKLAQDGGDLLVGGLS